MKTEDRQCGRGVRNDWMGRGAKRRRSRLNGLLVHELMAATEGVRVGASSGGGQRAECVLSLVE